MLWPIDGLWRIFTTLINWVKSITDREVPFRGSRPSNAVMCQEELPRPHPVTNDTEDKGNALVLSVSHGLHVVTAIEYVIQRPFSTFESNGPRQQKEAWY